MSLRITNVAKLEKYFYPQPDSSFLDFLVPSIEQRTEKLAPTARDCPGRRVWY